MYLYICIYMYIYICIYMYIYFFINLYSSMALHKRTQNQYFFKSARYLVEPNIYY